MTANTPPPATGRDTGARLATACSLCDDCFHPSFGPNMDGEPCDYCRDCGCPSAEHTQPPAPQAGASVEAHPTPALELAHIIDPAAFEDHPIEQRRRAAALQWAARRHIAMEHAERVVASDWLAQRDAAVRAEVGERIASAIEAEYLGADFGRQYDGRESPDALQHHAYDEGLQEAAEIARTIGGDR